MVMFKVSGTFSKKNTSTWVPPTGQGFANQKAIEQSGGQGLAIHSSRASVVQCVDDFVSW